MVTKVIDLQYHSHRRINAGNSAILQQYAIFRDADARLQDEMIYAAIRIRLEPGSFFYCKGSACRFITLIGNGNIRVFVDAESQREVTLYHIGPGDTCPINLLSALRGHRVPAHARIEAPTNGLMFPAELFRRWVECYPNLQRYVFDVLSTRLMDVLLRVEEITFQRVDRRLADYLLNQFKQCEQPPANIQITHEQIAQELGSAREVITRILKTFEREGAVKLGRGQIYLRDRAPLCHYVLGEGK